MIHISRLRIAAIFFLFSLGAAFAHSGATGIVKERMESMKAIAAGMKEIGLMIRSPETYDQAKANAAIERVQDNAARTTTLYPEGSLKDPSEARPTIWENPARFEKLAKSLEDSAGKLKAVIASAQTVDDLIKPFKQVGNTCKACHSDFRIEK